MLRAAGTTPPIENTPNPSRTRSSSCRCPPSEVVDGVDVCIVTHLHGDHFDDAAELLPRDLPILTQPESARRCAAAAHTNVDDTEGSSASPMTRGRHGIGAIGEAMGPSRAGSSTASTSPATRSCATRCTRRSNSTSRA